MPDILPSLPYPANYSVATELCKRIQSSTSYYLTDNTPNHFDDDAALQGLTTAALDEEEADRAAAVQEVVTVLSGDIAGGLLEILKSEVESLVEELRLEVAVGAEREHEREVEQALQVRIFTDHSGNE